MTTGWNVLIEVGKCTCLMLMLYLVIKNLTGQVKRS